MEQIVIREFDKEEIYYVYAHYRPNDNIPFYIGKGFGKRAWWKYSRNKWWHSIVNKHGGFDVKILLDNLNECSSMCMEAMYINAYGRADQGKGPLVNMTDGGDGISGYKHTQETKEIIRNTHLGNVYSVGRKHSPEEIENRISKIRGKPKPEDWIAWDSERMKGDKNPMFGKPASEYNKEISRIANTKYVWKLIDSTGIEMTFKDQRELSKFLDVSRSVSYHRSVSKTRIKGYLVYKELKCL